MWHAIGDTIPLAIGLALSPFAIVTGIVLLLGQKGRLKTMFFALGWLVAILVIAAIALVVVDVADAAYTDDEVTSGVNVVQLIFAVLFLALALVSWLRRPRDNAPPKSKLLDRLDGLSILGALGIGLAQGFVVIKNLPLALGAGARFGEAGLAGPAAVTALIVFAVVASLGVLIPLAVAVFTGSRLAPALQRTREWIEANMTSITVVVLLILGGYFLGQGIGLLD